MNYIQFQNQFHWQLDVDIWTLSDKDCDLLLAADMLQEYRLSIRQCSTEYMIPKSTLHSFISDGRLRSLSFELYCLCRKQIQWNKKHPSHFRKNCRR